MALYFDYYINLSLGGRLHDDIEDYLNFNVQIRTSYCDYWIDFSYSINSVSNYIVVLT